MKDYIDALVVHPKVCLQIPDEECSRNVLVREARSGMSLLRNEPALLKPKLQRLPLKARISQKLLLVHNHDMFSSRGLNSLPLAHLETNASSSGSEDLGKTIFSLTN